MSAWAALVLMTSAALAAASWLAARSIAHLADRGLAGAAQPRRRPGVRLGSWAASAATAIGVGAVAGHPFAAAILLAPALAVDHLCVRLWGGSCATDAATAHVAGAIDRPDDDQALDDCWQEALRLGVDAAVVETARERCNGLLRAQHAEPFELAMLDWAVFLRRCVPDLVVACGEELCMSQDAARRAALLEQMAEAVEKIGVEAERRRDAGRAIAHHRFEVARDHALRRVAEAELQP